MILGKMYRYSNIGDQIILDEFPIIKKTPRGVNITLYGKRRFINTTDIKQYAYETKELALKSFIKRKEMQIKILSIQLSGAEATLKHAKESTVENIVTHKDFEFDEL